MSVSAGQTGIRSPDSPTEFRHEAFFYAGEDRFVAGAMPFIRDGVVAGEPILVAVSEARIRALKAALGSDAERVHFVDMHEVGLNPARIIPVWRDFIDVHGVARQPVRGIGEPVWPGRSTAELVECRHHESLVNLTFDGGVPWRLMCPYDVDALGSDALEIARRTHPSVVEGDGHEHANESYVPPDDDPGPFEGSLPAPAGSAAASRFAGDDLAGVRAFVYSAATDAGLDPERTANVVLAASELAANSVRHADGCGTVRAWSEPGEFIAEVSDGGHFDDPMVGRIRPTPVQLYGRGLWLVNQFCDLVQIRSAGDSSVVRVHMRLS